MQLETGIKHGTTLRARVWVTRGSFQHTPIMKVVALYTNRSILDFHDIGQSGGGATVKFMFGGVGYGRPQISMLP